MRQLLPSARESVVPYDAYRPADPHAPLLRLNMVASADGSATDEHGRTERLGGQGDREVFRTLRALADGIVVGAGTARAEGYGPHRIRRDLRERRRAEGRGDRATVVVVTRSLALDFSAPLFTEADPATVVLTCSDAPANRRREAERVGRLVLAGDGSVDLAAGIAVLRRELGLAHLLCEGGPTLNASLLAEGLVDELCLTIGPRLIGGAGPRIVSGSAAPVELDLAALYEQEGELYARYRLHGRKRGRG